MKTINPRTIRICETNHISFPIGSIAAVKKYFSKLGLSKVFGRHKKRGRDLTQLTSALVSYKLTENLSISKASDWINRPDVLDLFGLSVFEERTLFRVLERIGAEHEQIIFDLQKVLLETYDFEHTDIVMDWTSLILWGDKAELGRYGYSRDHRPDKKQITLGLTALSDPINIPVGLTVKEGNVVDVTHFKSTYSQVRGILREGSLITFDRGAYSKDNLDLIVADKMKYLTAKKLNKSNDKRIATFDPAKAELVDEKNRVYGVKYVKPSRIDYLFYSETLARSQIEARKRKAQRKFEEAKEIQDCLDNKKKLPKKYLIHNELVDVTISYQTKLKQLGEEEAKRYIERVSFNGREGFFCITSTEDLTLKPALYTYRKKDSIEKIINSLKNEIEIKPLRVWTEHSIRGALIIGFIAQLIISLIRYDYEELRNVSTTFIKKSLEYLTVTVEYGKNQLKRWIFSNFNPINRLIFVKNQAIS